MSPRVRVHTHTYTRLAALRMHSARFLELAGVDAQVAARFADAIGRRELDGVGVYAVDHTNRRVLEQEFVIDWGQSDLLASSAPVIDASQPGWEDDLAVEVRVACERFRGTVQHLNLRIGTFVQFTKAIRSDPSAHETKRQELRLGGTLPEWKGAYQEQRLGVTGLGEATIIMRVYDG